MLDLTDIKYQSLTLTHFYVRDSLYKYVQALICNVWIISVHSLLIVYVLILTVQPGTIKCNQKTHQA